MDQKTFLKQTLAFNKSVFDNTFSAVGIAQEQTEKMFLTYLDQNPMLPEEGKNAIKQWIDTYKTGLDEFKKLADNGYEKVEDFFNK
jgi:Na+-transporting NADH:ubiquinone oxidoreductase subunit NqrA